MKHSALYAAFTLLLAAPVLHGAVVLGGILGPAPGASLYETDNGSGNINRFTPAGVQSTFSSLGAASAPTGLVFDAAGNLYVAAAGSHILKITPAGVQSTFATGFTSLIGLAFDASGNLYAADQLSSTITKITPGGVQSTFTSGGMVSLPQGLAFDAAGNLYEADAGSSSIVEITPAGGQSFFVHGGLITPEGVAFDGAGNLYVSEDVDKIILKFSPTGTLLGTFASGLNVPVGLAFDAAGNLYEADSGSGNIFKFTPGGVKSTFASGLNSPYFLAFAPAPNDDFQIRYFSNVTTLGGSLINLTNTGATDGATVTAGTICANIYVFDPNEEELECCSCQITPNALQSISVAALLSQNLTPEKPDSTVVKLLATPLTGGTCDPTTAGSATNPLVPGLRAWASTLHSSGGTSGFTYGTETEFSPAGATLSQGELNRLTNTCAFIKANGSGNGQCSVCSTAGGQ